MGNLCGKKASSYKSFDKNPLENNLILARNNESIEKIIQQINILNIDIQIQKEKSEKLERQLQRLEIMINSKCAELQFSVNATINTSDSNSRRINIITSDMVNLLNNDKLLLEKMIEKNIISTIQDS